MASITMYTKGGCPYCARAKQLLADKGVDVNDIPAAYDREKREEMIARAGGARTFPQIFIGDRHIGGCDDLIALDRAGELDPLLAAQDA